MDYKKILIGLLSKAYNIDESKFTDLENSIEGEGKEDVLIDSLAAFDAQKVDDLKSQINKAREEGIGRGTKESLTNFEKKLIEAFGLEDSNSKGIDLVKEIVQKHVSDKGGKQLTDEEVKRHPLFLDLEERRRKEIAETEQTWQSKYNELNSSIERNQKLSKVKQKVNEILTGLNPILPTSENARQNQLNQFLSQFESLNYQIEDDKGRIVILDENSSPLTDNHNNIIQFDSFVKEKASNYWDFKQHNGGSNGTGAGDADDTNTTFATPKTLDELAAIVNDPSKTPEEKAKAAEAFEQIEQKV